MNTAINKLNMANYDYTGQFYFSFPLYFLKVVRTVPLIWLCSLHAAILLPIAQELVWGMTSFSDIKTKIMQYIFTTSEYSFIETQFGKMSRKLRDMIFFK